MVRCLALTSSYDRHLSLEISLDGMHYMEVGVVECVDAPQVISVSPTAVPDTGGSLIEIIAVKNDGGVDLTCQFGATNNINSIEVLPLERTTLYMNETFVERLICQSPPLSPGTTSFALKAGAVTSVLSMLDVIIIPTVDLDLPPSRLPFGATNITIPVKFFDNRIDYSCQLKGYELTRLLSKKK
jgi:hypothetical protein